jgi:hypothetical protein
MEYLLLHMLQARYRIIVHNPGFLHLIAEHSDTLLETLRTVRILR